MGSNTPAVFTELASTVTGSASAHVRVTVVGDVAVDYTLQLPSGASGDEKTTVLRSATALGGTGANAAATVARLGGQAILIAPVGRDPWADWAAGQLDAQGIDSLNLQRRDGATTRATVLLQDEDRRVLVDRGVADELVEVSLGGGEALPDVLYLTGSPQLIRSGSSAAIDPHRSWTSIVGVESWMAAATDLVPVLTHADYVLTNEAGWASFRHHLEHAVTVIETRSSDGSVIHHLDGRTTRVPATAIEAVDATGAGDCYAGALCYYLAAGEVLIAACELASTAAALATRQPGAQSALPSDNEVRIFATGHVPNRPRQEAP